MPPSINPCRIRVTDHEEETEASAIHREARTIHWEGEVGELPRASLRELIVPRKAFQKPGAPKARHPDSNSRL